MGLGFDLHRLVPGRELILGGVHIANPLGLEGHSDADVVVHALLDALLGAAGQRDIGWHFPPGDPSYEGISSLLLLERVREILADDCWRPVNADIVVIAEAPRLAPFVEGMRDNLAAGLGLARGRVMVKATTTEGLGCCGRGEGIAAQAVVLIESVERPAPPGPAGGEAG